MIYGVVFHNHCITYVSLRIKTEEEKISKTYKYLKIPEYNNEIEFGVRFFKNYQYYRV